MIKRQKKIFPKLKKKLRSFLTNESGKITKKDAFGLSAGVVLFTNIDEVIGHHNEVAPSGYYDWEGYYVPPSPGYFAANHSSSFGGSLPGSNGHASGAGGTCVVSGSYSEHASGIVNGHYSSNVAGNISGNCNAGTAGHGNVSHTSHDNNVWVNTGGG